jgi:hypothetical protein
MALMTWTEGVRPGRAHLHAPQVRLHPLAVVEELPPNAAAAAGRSGRAWGRLGS